MSIALIPARGGSKGLPGKNLLKISGNSLLARAIGCALDSQLFKRVIVSSDSEEILTEAKYYGAEAFMRPKHLASDASLVWETIDHCMSLIDELPEFIALLEPTSPQRTVDLLLKTHALLAGEEGIFTVNIVEPRLHAYRQYFMTEVGYAQKVFADRESGNRQSLAPVYHANGGVYWFRSSRFLESRSIVTNRTRLFVVDPPLISVDTLADYEIVKDLIERMPVSAN